MSRSTLRFIAIGIALHPVGCDRPAGLRLQAPVSARAEAAPIEPDPPPNVRNPDEPTTGPLDDLDRARGLLWRFRAAAPIVGDPVVTSRGDVYVATSEGVIHALGSDGAFRWSYTAQGTVVHGPSLGPHGRLYVPTHSRRIYALTPEGALSWVFRSPVGIETSIGVGARGVLYFGGEDRALWAVSSRAGAMWRGRMPDAIVAGPVLDETGRTVLVASESGRLSWMTGAVRRQNLELGESLSTAPLLLGGGAAVVLLDRGAVCVEPGGAERWVHAGIRWIGRSPDSGLIAVAADSELMRIDLQGRVESLGRVPAPPSAAPVVIGEYHAVVAADGRLWLGNKEPEWRSIPVTYGPLSSAVADPERQRVIVASGEGTVAAVAVGN